MKTRNTLTRLTAITMAVAAAGLLCGAIWLQPVQAQTSDGSVKFVAYTTVGLVEHQLVRVTVGNPVMLEGNLSLSFSYYLAHGGNASSVVPVYESEWRPVRGGEILSSDFRREQLKTDGELETGRALVIVKVAMIAPAGSNPDDFPISLEVMKDGERDGQSVQDSKYRLTILAAQRSKQLAPIALDPGERLSYTLFNPNEEGSQPVIATTYTYDAAGRLMSQTPPVQLGPGESYTANINRDDLRVAGDDRLLVGTHIQVSSMDGSVRSVRLAVSMERVDSTGKTNGGNYFTGTVSVSGDG